MRQTVMLKSAQSGYSPHLLRGCVSRGTLTLQVTGLSHGRAQLA